MAIFNQEGQQVGSQVNIGGSGVDSNSGWRQESPRLDGWYWAEDHVGQVSMVFVQRIVAGAYWHVWNPSEKKEYGTADFTWWYGPLAYPTRLTRRVLSTEGGAYIGGNLTVTGDFVGRDKRGES